VHGVRPPGGGRRGRKVCEVGARGVLLLSSAGREATATSVAALAAHNRCGTVLCEAAHGWYEG
jgi:hypothetical protein